MARYANLYRSSDYDSPELGGYWGDFIGLVRAIFTDGYNFNSSAVEAEIIDYSKVKITFSSPHNYAVGQNLKFADGNALEYPLNEILFVIDTSDEYIIVETKSNVTNIGYIISLDGLDAVLHVAPLNIAEEFSDWDRAAFRVGNSYLYIDDIEPGNWNYGNNVLPLVYLTEHMEDIDTDGSIILPAINNTNRHKEKLYSYGAEYKTGLWHFPSHMQNNEFNWTIIGTESFFYYILYNNDNTFCNIYCAGKLNGSQNHILKAHSYSGDYNDNLYYASENCEHFNNSNITINNVEAVNIGKRASGVLDDLYLHQALPVSYYPETNYSYNVNGVYLSGYEYSPITTFNEANRYELCKIKVYDTVINKYRGTLPGCLYIPRSKIYRDHEIIAFKNNNVDEYLYHVSYDGIFNNKDIKNGQYAFSLNYDLWN